MKETVTFSTFTDRFKALRPDKFSYKGLRALFKYLEDYEDDIGEDIDLELDVIALCCEFTEYKDYAEYKKAYGEEAYSQDILANHTVLIDIYRTEGFIIQDY